LRGAGGVERRGHNEGGIASLQRANPGRLFDGPLLTLVNGGTASASEILAGALQDAGRSELMGSRTFGKGLIQTLIPLGDGSGLAVTVARYLTPSGRDIQAVGIELQGAVDDHVDGLAHQRRQGRRRGGQHHQAGVAAAGPGWSNSFTLTGSLE
jgi:carboxyl-terminal processing protease